MKLYCIYLHINKINHKVYVGQTCQQPEKRWKNGAGYSEKTQPKMYNAIKKYGWENFDHIIVKTGLTLAEANKLEQELIKKYDSFRNGYNMSLGGDGNPGHKVSNKARLQMKTTHKVPHNKAKGKKFSEEHKEKLRQAKLGKKRGTLGQETKDKISRALLGKQKSDLAKKNMSKAKKGVDPWNKGLTGITGHKQSEKTKNLISQKNSTAVAMCDINKNILKMFQSIGQAADYLKLTHIKANRTILGKHINTDKPYYGYLWIKLEKENY